MENQLHQVETAGLMPTPTTAPDRDTGRSLGRRHFFCLAGVMTAAGGAMAYLGSRYSEGFWRAGSQSRTAAWTQGLSRSQRNISQSLMNVAQKPLAAPLDDSVQFTPISKADAFIAAAQLLTGPLVPSMQAPQIVGSSRDVGLADAGSDRAALSRDRIAGLADQLVMEKSTLLDGEHGHRHDVSQADQQVREKKNIQESKDDFSKNLVHHVDKLLEEQGASDAIRERFRYRITHYQTYQLPVFAIKSLIQESILHLEEMARASHPDATARNEYHALYFGLRLLWKFTRVFHDDELSSGELDQYKETLQKGRWNERQNTRIGERGSAQLDAQIVIDYLASRCQTWREQRLAGDDNIVFHNDQETRMFSIADVLDCRHADFLGESESGLYFHLQYDNTGLRDPDLLSLVRSATNQQLFINFKQAPRYQPEGYYKIAAEQLVELHLQQMPATPLHFDYLTAIERAIERAAAQFLPNRSIDRATKETLAAMERLQVVKTKIGLTEKIVQAYACGYVLAGEDSLFGGLEKQQILDSDYIYRYQDAKGQTRSAITSLDLFLCRGAKELNNELGQRDGVTMLWPEQFSTALIAYLNDGDKIVNIFASKVAAEVRLIALEHNLTRELPSLSRLLQGYIEEVGRVYGIEECNLSDQIEFTYKEIISLPLGQEATAGDHVKNMTIMQILVGDERSWKLVDVPLHLRFITNIPATVPARMADNYKSYIQSLLAFDVQGRLSSKFESLRQNADLKVWFNEYVDIVTADLQVPGVPLYEFSDTPLLQIFPVRNPSREEWEAGRQRSNPYGKIESNAWLKGSEIPFHVISLVSRKADYFKSYADMLARLSQDKEFAAHVKAHFSVGYANGFSDLAVAEIYNKNDLYERRIDWTLNNFDRIIKSTGEMMLFSVIEGAGSIGFIFGEMLSLVHPKLGLLLSVASISGSKLLQGMLVSTRPDEQKALVKTAIFGLLEEMGGKVIGQMGGVYKDKISEEKLETIDQAVKQGIDLILGRYFMNATADWE